MTATILRRCASAPYLTSPAPSATRHTLIGCAFPRGIRLPPYKQRHRILLTSKHVMPPAQIINVYVGRSPSRRRLRIFLRNEGKYAIAISFRGGSPRRRRQALPIEGRLSTHYPHLVYPQRWQVTHPSSWAMAPPQSGQGSSMREGSTLTPFAGPLPLR